MLSQLEVVSCHLTAFIKDNILLYTPFFVLYKVFLFCVTESNISFVEMRSK